jgi:hypothetical protein
MGRAKQILFCLQLKKKVVKEGVLKPGMSV